MSGQSVAVPGDFSRNVVCPAEIVIGASLSKTPRAATAGARLFCVTAPVQRSLLRGGISGNNGPLKPCRLRVRREFANGYGLCAPAR